jgi:hypothetical protein
MQLKVPWFQCCVFMLYTATLLTMLITSVLGFRSPRYLAGAGTKHAQHTCSPRDGIQLSTIREAQLAKCSNSFKRNQRCMEHVIKALTRNCGASPLQIRHSNATHMHISLYYHACIGRSLFICSTYSWPRHNEFSCLHLSFLLAVYNMWRAKPAPALIASRSQPTTTYIPST